jgi:hypothetical protein
MRKLMLQANRKLLVIMTIVVVVIFGTAGTTAPVHSNVYKNLKILPQDISREAMHDIMDVQFGDALGVHCDYCHAKEPGADHPDFASDANPKKETARDMMRMVLQMNKENFQVAKPMIGDSLMVVTCYTCHHGSAFPDTKSKVPVVHDFGPPAGRAGQPGPPPPPPAAPQKN